MVNISFYNKRINFMLMYHLERNSYQVKVLIMLHFVKRTELVNINVLGVAGG